MSEQNFQLFRQALLTATENIRQPYFRLPVAYEVGHVARERAYCYELYHQLRLLLPGDFNYTLSGEVDKAGHPLICNDCGTIKPDFLVHRPGNMGPEDNLVIVEVKTIEGAHFNDERESYLKDLSTINCMTSLRNGYYRGVVLVFGANFDDRKQEIERIYRDRCDNARVLLLFHEQAETPARII